MTKAEFLAHVKALYVVGNRSDSHDDPQREDWTHSAMAGEACCSALDNMLRYLTVLEVLTEAECQAFYDNM